MLRLVMREQFRLRKAENVKGEKSMETSNRPSKILHKDTGLQQLLQTLFDSKLAQNGLKTIKN